MVNSLPVPSHVSEVSETGLEKILLFPEKLKHLGEIPVDSSYPVSIEFSPTSKCNFRCVWCGDRKLRQNRAGTLPLEVIESLFEDIATHGTKGVVIEGGGEPTLHPQFDEIIHIATQHGLALGLLTNGSLRLPAALVRNFEWIRVSLDAATSSQHTELKGTDSFELVMENIRVMVQQKDNTTIGIGYVVTCLNTSHLEELVHCLRDYGIDYIQFRPVVDHPELLAIGDLSYLKKLQTEHFKIDLTAISANKNSGNGGLPCIAHSLTSVINSDGSVYICGRLNIHEWIKPIGNICHNRFSKIWMGEDRQRQAAELANSDFCMKHCPVCRMTKYNRLLANLSDMKTRNFI